ncbi:hypothetical protein H7X87_04085 [Acetobacteraceae bacterium]|nr:hypothetical protein [Candidatus Parcubacteria bacterium]
MKGEILITDSLFIFSEHEKMLKDAGFKIERLDKPEPTEDELIEGVKGKVGYLLGGLDRVTEKVIDAADELKAISFCGIGYKDFIPAWEYATKKGIAISNAPDGPTHAVAEWALGMALAMNRGFFEIGRAGEKSFMTTLGIEGQHIGIMGFGRIGRHIAQMLLPFRPASIAYTSLHHHDDAAQKLNAMFKEKEALLKESDVIFLCVSKDAGENYLREKEIGLMKDKALLISFMHPEIIDEAALLKALQSGHIRAASDYPAKNEVFKNLPFHTWYSFNGSNAFNTTTELKITSDMATQSLINLLTTGQDQYKVN